MKKENEKQNDKPKKVWRKLHDHIQTKPVCNCKFGCLDIDTRNAIHGVSQIRRSVLSDPNFNLMGL